MKEKEIAAYILQHDARNLQLKRRLAEQGIDWRTEPRVVCRFRAPSRQQASELARELEQKGFAVVEVAELARQSSNLWRIAAHRRQTLEQIASHECTEEMVRSAAALACFYGGWEARMACRKQ